MLLDLSKSNGAAVRRGGEEDARHGRRFLQHEARETGEAGHARLGAWREGVNAANVVRDEDNQATIERVGWSQGQGLLH